ncbi:hypothetical protein ElyMa_006949800 [Elysia marginata]|uniref:Uncharacterized protein n=1 Tax=Elysia marginata TaxID=1093978 RepID=A0AAV4JLY0_9GAST|nr:hypothetical protein ElyMa_006949800 [Elysia marginata]
MDLHVTTSCKPLADPGPFALQSQGNWATREMLLVTRLPLHGPPPLVSPARSRARFSPPGEGVAGSSPGRSARLSDHSNTPGNLNIVNSSAGGLLRWGAKSEGRPAIIIAALIGFPH